MSLAPLPKLLDVAGVGKIEQLATRVGEWVRAAQILLQGVRTASEDHERRIRDLERRMDSL